MNLRLLMLSFVFVGLMACNNTAVEEPNTDADETEQHDHDMDMDSESELGAVPADAKVFFANLEDGQTVSSPVHVVMGMEGMEIHPAGEIIEGTGHHHILVNQGNHYPAGEVIPADEAHIHFGTGATETDLELEPGEYTLTMQFADGAHRSYGEQMAATVKIIVE